MNVARHRKNSSLTPKYEKIYAQLLLGALLVAVAGVLLILKSFVLFYIIGALGFASFAIALIFAFIPNTRFAHPEE